MKLTKVERKELLEKLVFLIMKLTKVERKELLEKRDKRLQWHFWTKFLILSQKLKGSKKEKLEKITKLGELIDINWKTAWKRYHSKEEHLEHYLSKMVRIYQSNKYFLLQAH